ncbi:nucleotidyltransferase domain-containing protein [bacterium]|nr:nucleotidyltransferase domain-containing protein [bacterium]MBU1615832.1 nucleotidyltransferase domain-containing protein [bacterium]
MLQEQDISKIRENLVSKFAPQRIILFGSQATGKADNRSDVDLLVISQIKEKRRELMLKMDGALDSLDYAFDILILTSEEFECNRFIPGTIARYASQEGRVIYECK